MSDVGHDGRKFSGRARAIAFVAVVAVVATLVIAATTITREDGGDSAGTAFSAPYRAATQAYQQRIEETKERRALATEPDDAIALESYRAILAATEAARRDYAEATPPPADVDEYAQFLVLLDQQVASLRQAEEAAAAKRRADVLAALKLYGIQLARWISLRQRFDSLAGFEPAPGASSTPAVA